MIEIDKKELEAYQDRLNRILDATLSLVNIDSFGESALLELIGIISECVAKYKYTAEYINSDDSPSIVENKALKHFGLPEVTDILHDIISIDNLLKNLDSNIATMTTQLMDRVIVPPESGTIIEMGSGTYIAPAIVPKLKTLLFILNQEFGIGLDKSSGSIKITKGIVEPEMMRQVSYNLVEIPKINREVLICDEEGNVTYVFVTDLLENLGISPGSLIDMSKSELDNIIKANPKIGERVLQTGNFVPRLILALYEPNSARKLKNKKPIKLGKYLRPKPPKDYLTANEIAKELKIDNHTVQAAINEVIDELGDVAIHGGNKYSPEQVIKIKNQLMTRGSIAEKAPRGVLNNNGMAKRYKVSNGTIKKIIESLGDELGEPKKYYFNHVIAEGFSRGQRAKIRRELIKGGNLSPAAPDGYRSMKELAESLGVDYGTVKKAYEQVINILGEVKYYKFKTRIAKGFSEEQQTIIKQKLGKV